MINSFTEERGLARLQRVKASYQSHIVLNYEHAASSCSTCSVRGVCCTDAHFVNVHITRLEAISIRETLERTPRLSVEAKRAVYTRAREAVARYNLRALTADNSFAQTYACPLYEPTMGCLVHRRAKPAPCIQHACYENWEDLPPHSLQSRAEHRIEQLNTAVYGAAWAWLPTPLWLCLVDPHSGGRELERLALLWAARPRKSGNNSMHQAQPSTQRQQRARRSLPVLRKG